MDRDRGESAGVGATLNRGDVEAIACEANTFQANGETRAPVLCATVLSFGCRLWLELGFGIELTAPPAGPMTPKFAAELMQEMGRKVPILTEFPELKGVAKTFQGLSIICREVSEKAPLDIVGTEALFAGILVGRLGHLSGLDVDDEELRAAFMALGKSERIEKARQASIIKTRIDKEEALVTFAEQLIASDPTVSNMEIQRQFRAQQNPREKATASNNEAKILARFRNRRLPPRKRKSP